MRSKTLQRRFATVLFGLENSSSTRQQQQKGAAPTCTFRRYLSLSGFIEGRLTGVLDEHDVRRGSPMRPWMTVTIEVSTTKGTCGGGFGPGSPEDFTTASGRSQWSTLTPCPSARLRRSCCSSARWGIRRTRSRPMQTVNRCRAIGALTGHRWKAQRPGETESVSSLLQPHPTVALG